MTQRWDVACKPALMVFWAMSLLAVRPAEAEGPGEAAKKPLPNLYPYVASDILEWSQPRVGVWVDLGAGAGDVALAVASSKKEAAARSTIVLLDPDADALSRALGKARKKGLENRLVTVVGVAEEMPLPDNSVDLVFSRGSIFFWDDQPSGIREIYRVLRPGGKAMIGGGRGSQYPEWARREFARRRHGGRDSDSPQAREFARLRDPETFRRWAKEAGIPDFEVIGQGALPPDDPRASAGVWLRFTKREAK
ncbi:MAG: class I SAM-dependent methyltransferase [Pirellulaceae bacterium]